MVSAVRQRAVEGDEVALGEQLVQLHILRKGQIRVMVHVVSQDPHPEAVADLRHGRADLAGADDTGGLAEES